MTLTTAIEVAERMRDAHEASFGGKTRGRFKMTRDSFRDKLAGRTKLEKSFVEEIARVALSEYQLVLIDLGSEIAVIQEQKVRAWRSPPAKMKFD